MTAQHFPDDSHLHPALHTQPEPAPFTSRADLHRWNSFVPGDRLSLDFHRPDGRTTEVEIVDSVDDRRLGRIYRIALIDEDGTASKIRTFRISREDTRSYTVISEQRPKVVTDPNAPTPAFQCFAAGYAQALDDLASGAFLR